jgi:uncharacterized YigZ family protein
MPTIHKYLVPTRTITVEQEIKRSRFITAISRATHKDEAVRFIESVRTTHASATHNCWAFVAGSPEDAMEIGMSDDGEPSGTAGKPMLNVLQHSGIGEVVAVVTRYFGGIKLGTGGLVRAYASSVQLGLKELPVEEFVETLAARITLPFPYENAIRHFLKEINAEIIEVVYGNDVVMEVTIPANISTEFPQQIKNLTQGKAEVHLPDEG